MFVIHEFLRFQTTGESYLDERESLCPQDDLRYLNMEISIRSFSVRGYKSCNPRSVRFPEAHL